MSVIKRNILLAIAVAALALGSAAEAGAQVRAVRVVPGRSVVVVGGGFYGGFYGRPYWSWDPWFGFGYPYGWWGAYPYPYPYPYRYPYAVTGEVRLDVKPKEADVYVDGYYAGIVDDFNGVFHKLHLPPGEHEIVLYRDGFRAVHQKVFLTPDKTLKLKYNMEQLGAGETQEPRPQPPNPPPGTAMQPGPPGAPGAPDGQQPPMYPRQPRGGVYPMPPQPMPPQPMPGQPQAAPPSPAPQVNAPSGYGTLTIRVQPGDCDVIVDQERWRGPAGQDRLAIDLAEGRHTVEVQKSGYRTYVTEIEIRRGETTPLNVSLRSQDDR